jgi:hypothetical protein
MDNYGTGKATIVRETQRFPEVLDRYKLAKRGEEHRPLTHEDLAIVEGEPGPDWDALLAAVSTLKPGGDDAARYENAIESLLTALFFRY